MMFYFYFTVILLFCPPWFFARPCPSTFDLPLPLLSGTSNLEQLKANLRIFENAEPGLMSAADQALVAAIRKAFAAKQSIG